MTSVIQYNLEFFENLIFEGIEYRLNDDVLSKIEDVAKQVGSPEYIKTPQFDNRRLKGSVSTSRGVPRNKHKKVNYELKSEDWAAIRNFEATKMKKSEGVELSIDLVRKHLNKVTDKNYDKLIVDITNELDKIAEEYDLESTKHELSKISKTIFKIASGNMFYSELYAKLYKTLCDKYDFIKSEIINDFNEFKSIFKNIEYCDPNDDYDKFCENNKNNEKRRALGLFYVNLCKYDLIDSIKVINIIKEIQDYMMEVLIIDNKKPLVEELSELLYVMIVNGKDIFCDDNVFTKIIEKVSNVSNMKVKDYVSLTNKTKFKHMDIMDELE